MSRITFTARKTRRRMLLTLVVLRGIVELSTSKPKVVHDRAHHRQENKQRVRAGRVPRTVTEYTRQHRAKTKRGVTGKRNRVQLGPHSFVEAAIRSIMGVRANLQ